MVSEVGEQNVHKVGSKWTRVLPAVYDESLSYDEVLNKLCYKVNELIDYINKTSTQDILPKNDDGTINWGSKGDFAVSNGVNSLEWFTMKNGSEVRY